MEPSFWAILMDLVRVWEFQVEEATGVYQTSTVLSMNPEETSCGEGKR